MLTMKDIIDDKNPLIRKKSKDISIPVDEQTRKLGIEMFEYLKNSQDEEISEKYDLRPGVGLAAVQVGVLKRMLAIYIPETDENGEMTHCDQYILVNPKLISYTAKPSYLKNGEGCLSVPIDQQGIVPRHAKVTVEAYDLLTDKQIKIVARGFLSICLQHEMDHLDGILYYDHFNKDNPNTPISNAIVIE